MTNNFNLKHYSEILQILNTVFDGNSVDLFYDDIELYEELTTYSQKIADQLFYNDHKNYRILIEKYLTN